MNAGEIADVLRSPQRVVGQPSVALQINCDNLETVYLSLCVSGGVLVSDGGESFAYLARGTDSTYHPLDKLDLEVIASICRENGVTLQSSDPDSHPSIECVVAPEEGVSDAVARVAEAVDRLFAVAMRNS